MMKKNIFRGQMLKIVGSFVTTLHVLGNSFVTLPNSRITNGRNLILSIKDFIVAHITSVYKKVKNMSFLLIIKNKM